MVKLRRIEIEDLKEYAYWKQPHHSYHLLNGPYYRKETTAEIEKRMVTLRATFAADKPVLNHIRLITNHQNDMIGEVSWYWKSEETNWMEIGIVIFDDQFRKKGIGYQSLKLWIDEIFGEKTEMIRIGLTTWSGNSGMIKLAEKIGMKEEARYRKARIVNGKYFDSVSYGILKQEWQERQ